MSVNLNPASLNSAVFFTLAGHTYTYDDLGFPVNAPAAAQRWKILAANPVAAAQFFKIFMEAFCSEILGFPLEGTRQTEEACFRAVLHHLFKYETNQRGEMHAHGMIIQPLIQIRRLQTFFSSRKEELRPKLLPYLEAFSTSWLPEPHYTCEDCISGVCTADHLPATKLVRRQHNPTAEPDTAKANDEEPRQADKTGSTNREINKQTPAAMRQIPLPAVTRNPHGEFTFNCTLDRVAQYKEDLTRVLINVNWHMHTFTCGNGDCRLAYPRVERKETEVLNGCILLRRQHGSLVSYVAGIAAGTPINHTAYLMCHPDRWLREHKLWSERAAHGEVGLVEPEMPTLLMAAILASYYACKYTVKYDNEQLNESFINMVDALAKTREGMFTESLRHGSERIEAEEKDETKQAATLFSKARRNVSHLANALNGTVTYPATLIAFYLLIGVDHHKSFKTVALDAKLFVDYIKSGGKRDMSKHAAWCTPNEQGAFATALDDFLYRAHNLRGLSVYLLFFFFHRCKQSGNNHASFDFVAEHPLSLTHRLSDYLPDYRIPQIFESFPKRPPEVHEESADLQELREMQEMRETYAQFVLSLFALYNCDENPWFVTDKNPSHWEMFVKWRDSGEMPAYVRYILDNMENYKLAHTHRTETKARVRREQTRNNATPAETSAKFTSENHPDNEFTTVFANESFWDQTEPEDAVSARLCQPRDNADDADLVDDDINVEIGDLLNLPTAEERQARFSPISESAVMRMAPKEFKRRLRAEADAREALNHALQQNGPGRPTEKAHSMVAGQEDDEELTTLTVGPFNTNGPGMGQGSDFCGRGMVFELSRSGSEYLLGGRLFIVTKMEEMARGEWLRNFKDKHPHRIPYIKLKGTVVTPDDVIELFTLDVSQAFLFLLLTNRLHTMRHGWPLPAPEQLTLTVQGQPGTGKSQSLHAFVWYAFQVNLASHIATVAYTGKAAINVSTPPVPAATTTAFLKINTRLGNKPRTDPTSHKFLREVLDGVYFLLVDEYSFISQQHLAAMSQQVSTAVRLLAEGEQREMNEEYVRNRPFHEIATAEHFGGLNTIFTGDSNQHEPITGTPVSHKTSTTGRRIWTDIRHVIVLQENHRLKAGDAQAVALYRDMNVFASITPPTREEITRVLEHLHATRIQALDPFFTETHAPLVVTLRQQVRLLLNGKMVSKAAHVQRKQLFFWNSNDLHHLTNRPLSPAYLNIVRQLNSQKCGGVPMTNYFFEGIRYVFLQNDDKLGQYGWLKNNHCTGVAIILDEREPENVTMPDDRGTVPVSKLPTRRLVYPPLGVIVRPDGGSAMADFSAFGHSGCVAVKFDTRATEPCKVILPGPMEIDGETIREFTFKRKGLPLGEGYVVTDYFSQGMTFASPPPHFIAHLNPPKGPWSGASFYVVLSRFRTWDDIHHLLPLWKNEEEKTSVIDQICNKAKRSDTAVEEIRRLDAIAQHTQKEFAKIYNDAKVAVARCKKLLPPEELIKIVFDEQKTITDKPTITPATPTALDTAAIFAAVTTATATSTSALASAPAPASTRTATSVSRHSASTAPPTPEEKPSARAIVYISTEETGSEASSEEGIRCHVITPDEIGILNDLSQYAYTPWFVNNANVCHLSSFAAALDAMIRSTNRSWLLAPPSSTTNTMGRICDRLISIDRVYVHHEQLVLDLCATGNWTSSDPWDDMLDFLRISYRLMSVSTSLQFALRQMLSRLYHSVYGCRHDLSASVSLWMNLFDESSLADEHTKWIYQHNGGSCPIHGRIDPKRFVQGSLDFVYGDGLSDLQAYFSNKVRKMMRGNVKCASCAHRSPTTWELVQIPPFMMVDVEAIFRHTEGYRHIFNTSFWRPNQNLKLDTSDFKCVAVIWQSTNHFIATVRVDQNWQLRDCLRPTQTGVIRLTPQNLVGFTPHSLYYVKN